MSPHLTVPKGCKSLQFEKLYGEYIYFMETESAQISKEVIPKFVVSFNCYLKIMKIQKPVILFTEWSTSIPAWCKLEENNIVAFQLCSTIRKTLCKSVTFGASFHEAANEVLAKQVFLVAII